MHVAQAAHKLSVLYHNPSEYWDYRYKIWPHLAIATIISGLQTESLSSWLLIQWTIETHTNSQVPEANESEAPCKKAAGYR